MIEKQKKYRYLMCLLAAMMLVITLSSMKTTTTVTIILAAKFKAQLGLSSWFGSLGIDKRCKVVSYTLHYQPKRADAIIIKGKGSIFSGQVREAMNKAKSGDEYKFTNVWKQCACYQHTKKKSEFHFQIR